MSREHVKRSGESGVSGGEPLQERVSGDGCGANATAARLDAAGAALDIEGAVRRPVAPLRFRATMTIDDARLLQNTIERLRVETGLSAGSVHEMMEAMAALLLDRASERSLGGDGSITVTAAGLRAELLDLGMPAEQATPQNVEKVLDSLLAMAR